MHRQIMEMSEAPLFLQLDPSGGPTARVSATGMDQVQEAVRHGISSIYMDGSDTIATRIVEEA